ncbi:MAG: EAL domain-containing protein [Herminiimonas sp.]|nr:EAL domain-containing protein [Herminiimonas sp.]
MTAIAGDSGQVALDVLSRLVAAIEHTPMVAIQSFGLDGVVRLWNLTSASIYGISATEAIGHRLDTLLFHRGKEAQFSDTIARILETGQPVLPSDWEVMTVTGRELWVYSTMFPVFRSGKIHQIFCMDIDISVRKREEEALLAVGANFRTLFQRSANAIMLIEDDHFLQVNPAALELFGFTDPAQVLGQPVTIISPLNQPDGTPSTVKAAQMQVLVKQHGNQRFEWCHIRYPGRSSFWSEVLCTEIPIENKSLLYLVVRDISERKRANQALLLAAKVFENSQDGILIADGEQHIVSVNAAFSDITGYRQRDLIGSTPSILCGPGADPAVFKAIDAALAANDRWQGELWGRHRDGPDYPMWLSLTNVRDVDQKVVNTIGIVNDISERKAAEEQMRHLAEHDFLTSLPNRVLLLDRLQQAIATAERHQSRLAILFLDLDRFKNINDTFGHHVGDRLLRTVAERLKKCVRNIDTISRLGGDEFVIMLIDTGHSEPVAHIADNVLAAINQPYSIEGCDFTITTCIGISTYPNDGTNVDTLLKNADLAMYHAKKIGTNRYQFFDTDMNTRIVARMSLEHSLRNALKNKEFILQYQPQCRFADGKTSGVEALIRWRHPELGLLLPKRFIHVAEECGLIVPIGSWVLQAACQQAKTWQAHGFTTVVAVNLSAAQFQQKNLLESILDALHLAELDPRFLELEITENILMKESSLAITTLRSLREIGVQVTVDDFGTGFSSLSHLKHIPIDKLKIDQSFVRDIANDPENAAIICAILVMAKALQLKVVAEGVETREQFDFLQLHGCDEYQGYFASRELSAADIEVWRPIAPPVAPSTAA